MDVKISMARYVAIGCPKKKEKSLRQTNFYSGWIANLSNSLKKALKKLQAGKSFKNYFDDYKIYDVYISRLKRITTCIMET